MTTGVKCKIPAKEFTRNGPTNHFPQTIQIFGGMQKLQQQKGQIKTNK